MSDNRLPSALQPWMERRFGIQLSKLGADPVPVIPADSQADLLPLRALKIGERAAVIARPDWVEGLRRIVSDLHPDLLFSSFGTYELSRVTLRDGLGVWGPSWYLFADEESFRPADGPRTVHLEPSELGGFDYDRFWHCSPDSLAGFAIFDGDRLVALATVRDVGNPVWEIGMEVAIDAKGRGLGRAVVSAAARWILDNGRFVLATTAAFNVPSARTLRSVGLRYTAADMESRDGRFDVPPQPLGRPYAGADIYNYYPNWAMNQDIKPRWGS